MPSITTALGAGSGIDIQELVSSLVEAQYANRNAMLTRQEETLTTQISSVGELKSGITGFAAALSSLVKGGSLASQAKSANTGIVQATRLPGATLRNVSATVEVRALATAQVAAMPEGVAAGTRIGTGTLTLQIGSYGADGSFGAKGKAFPIEIDEASATLSGIAAKINGAGAGVEATVITDSSGERLMLKGATGAEQAFTLTPTGGDGGLAKVAVGGNGGMPVASAAGDARIAVDGVEVRRATNSVTGVIPGIRLDLMSAQVGTTVSIGSTRATDALTQAVSDVVATFNEYHAQVKAAVDPVTGPLRSDPGATQLMRSLGQLTLTPLTSVPSGQPRTLAEIGVATTRDGTLTLDAAKLARAITTYPDAVEAMFVEGIGASGKGLSAALSAISTRAVSATVGLGASEAKYSRAQATLDDEQAEALEAAETMRTRMTQQFASMDARVAAYRSTQTFLEQQVDAWNSQN